MVGRFPQFETLDIRADRPTSYETRGPFFQGLSPEPGIQAQTASKLAGQGNALAEQRNQGRSRHVPTTARTTFLGRVHKTQSVRIGLLQNKVGLFYADDPVVAVYRYVTSTYDLGSSS